MGNWTRTKAAGLLFAAAAAVYSDGLVRAMAADKEDLASSATEAAAAETVEKSTVKAETPKKASAAKGKPKADAPQAETELTKADVPAVDPFSEPLPVPVAPPSKTASAALTESNVNVSDTGLVEIHVNDANLGEVLKMLSMQLERNILASKEVRGTVTANLYDVTVKEALDAILRANDCGYREKGNVLYVYTKKELEDIEKAERKQVTETFRVYYTPAANAVNMLKPVLSPEAQVAFSTAATSGIDSSGSKDVGGNSHATEDTIVITDFPDRIDQVRKILQGS